MKKKFLMLFLLCVSIVSSFAHAQIACPTGGTAPTLAECSEDSSNSIKLTNPLRNGGVDDVPTLVEKILDIALTIAIPIIALAIIYAGFKFIAAQGKPDELEKAKQTILYVLVGSGILLGAYAIATAVVDTIIAIRG